VFVVIVVAEAAAAAAQRLDGRCSDPSSSSIKFLLAVPFSKTLVESLDRIVLPCRRLDRPIVPSSSSSSSSSSLHLSAVLLASTTRNATTLIGGGGKRSHHQQGETIKRQRDEVGSTEAWIFLPFRVVKAVRCCCRRRRRRRRAAADLKSSRTRTLTVCVVAQIGATKGESEELNQTEERRIGERSKRGSASPKLSNERFDDLRFVSHGRSV
jgi:hypothetical protein